MPENTLFKTALSKAMNLCSRREYCCYDICNKLLLWGVDYTDSERIINILIEENFIDDKRFASAFVNDKFRYNKWGKVKISAQLKAKKIPSEIIREALDTIDNELYINLIKELISSHRRSAKAKSPYDMKAKLLRYGLSKGFESTLLYDLLNEQEDRE